MTRLSLAGALLLMAFLMLACGPIEYVNTVTRRASTSVDSAKAAQADKYAPYYYTLAVEYLHQARVEAAGADYQAANRFGRKSDAAAKKAKELALKRVSDPEWKVGPAKAKDGAGDLAPLVPSDSGGDDEVPSAIGGGS